MISFLAALAALSFLGVLGYFKYKRDYEAGRTKEKAENAQKTLDSVKKSKDAVIRLDDAKRERLRNRYGIK